MANTPNVRFKGFTDDWEQRKLGDIADVTKLAGFEFTEHVVYSDKGNIIALRGLNIKDGQLVLDDVKYIDSSNFSKLHRSKLYINDIMFTYVGTVGEVAIIKENERFYLAPNVSRIRIASDDSPEYISQYMRTEQFYKKIIFPLIATSSQPALSMENIRKFIICLPKNKEEQNQIAECLSNLDHLIILHQQKCDEVRQLKKYMLQKVFPKSGEIIPEIRFTGFTNDWEQHKLGEIADKVTIKNAGTQYVETFTNSAEFGIISQRDFFDHDVSNMENIDGYYVVEDDAFVYNPRISTSAPVGPINRNKLGRTGVMSPLYTVFKTHDIDSEYLEWFFKSSCWYSFMYFNGDTGARSDRFSIKDAVFFEMPIPIPNIGEQRKIGKYLTQLDSLITLHQHKCEELKEVKRFMLQNMFPQKG